MPKARAESDEVLGFVGSECFDVDAKDFDDFICKPFFQNLQCFAMWLEGLLTTCIHHHDTHVLIAT